MSRSAAGIGTTWKQGHRPGSFLRFDESAQRGLGDDGRDAIVGRKERVSKIAHRPTLGEIASGRFMESLGMAFRIENTLSSLVGEFKLKNEKILMRFCAGS
jgi:hypothetical protein